MNACKKNNGAHARFVLSLVFAATLAACGGGGTEVVVAPTMAGKVINSYIYGAVVTLDSNDNGVCESSEPQVVSKIDGSYEFPGLGKHMVCSSGGYNTATNLPVVGEFKAPPGATVVTPLSTLVMARVGSTTGAPTDAQVAAAQASLETQLSLPAGSLAQDPVAAIASNPKIEQTNAAVEVMLQTVASSVSAFAGVTAPAATASATEKANYTAAVNAVFANAVKAVTSTLASATVNLNLTSAAGSANTDSFVQNAVATTVDNVKTAVAVGGGSNATASALNNASTGAAAAISNTSSTNAAAFVAQNVSTVVQSVAQVTLTTDAAANKLAIGAAATTAQRNVVIANSVEAVVAAAPTLFASSATSASTQVAALAQTVLPSASATSNAAYTSTPATVATALTTAATSASVTVNVSAAAAAVSSDVATPPAAPVPVTNLSNIPLPVVPKLPDPVVVTGAS